MGVAFRVADMEGDAYLNPRQQGDRENLERLTRQTRFPFVFCDKLLMEAVGKSVSWSEQQRKEMQAVLDILEIPGAIEGSFDPDFQQAKDLFQAQFSVRDILAAGVRR